MDTSTIAEGFSKLCIELDGRIKIGDRQIILTLRQVSFAAIAMSERILWVELDRSIEIGAGAAQSVDYRRRD